jgi:hypothetical protein
MTTQFFCQIWTNGDLAADADGQTPKAAYVAAVEQVELIGLTAMHLLYDIEKVKPTRYKDGNAYYFDRGTTLVRIQVETV